MNRLLLSAGLALVTITLTPAANAQMTDEARQKQLEAYRAYAGTQSPAPVEAGQADMPGAPAATAVVTTTTPIEPTTTVEKTTTTDYKIYKRKVGLVGGRSYKPRTEEIEGGVVKEITVNGVKTEEVIVKPDPMEGKTVESMDGDYYTGPQGIRAYGAEEDKTDLDVHYTGRFNK